MLTKLLYISKYNVSIKLFFLSSVSITNLEEEKLPPPVPSFLTKKVHV